MTTKQFHYLIAVIAFPITTLHFIFGDYKNDKLISGITFYTVATIIYVSFVYLYYKNEKGKKVVLWGLVIIAIVNILLILQQ
ncbi:hypothetical protein [Bacillus marinisedimentorum]|uniref:hypothetical protein n=1 Tax=Bacillus marinisedimentorum TaxID=1821260 RepID=UPI000871C9EC|nr:hypothetical protein [Bacillus marinisedimentorum]